MTNEEIIEELYWNAHNCGMFNEFSKTVNQKIHSQPTNVERITIVEEVYYEFVKLGLITQGQLML